MKKSNWELLQELYDVYESMVYHAHNQAEETEEDEKTLSEVRERLNIADD